MKKSPGAAEALLLIDTDLDGGKPRNVVRRPSLATGPQGPEEPRTPRAGLLFGESSLSPKKGDYGAVVMSDRKAVAREIDTRTQPRFIEIPRERGGGRGAFTEEQLSVMSGG